MLFKVGRFLGNVLGLILLILLSVCASTVTAGPVKLGVVHIDGLLEYDKDKLAYNHLLSSIFGDLRREYHATYLPHARTHKLIRQRSLMCAFPDNILQVSDPENFIQTLPVNTVTAHIFSLKQVYQRLEQLKGKVVVHRGQYEFDGLLNSAPGVVFVPIDTAEKAYELMAQGRAEAFIEYAPDIFFALNEEQQATLKYSMEDPLRVLHDRFLCIKSTESVLLVNELNEMIRSYHYSGRMAEILGSYYQYNGDQ